MKGIYTHERPDTCRICGRVNECATSFRDRNPKPPKKGDVLVCLNCGALSIYDTIGTRAPTDDERGRALDNPDLLSLIAAIKMRGRITE